jgi:hypothetical protein
LRRNSGSLAILLAILRPRRTCGWCLANHSSIVGA